MFKSSKINNKEVKNKVIRSATNEFYVTEEGVLTGSYLDYYETLAKGGVGTMITGHYFVNQQGRVSQNQVNPVHIENKRRLSELVQRVHKYDTLILMQLSHAGGKSKEDVTQNEVLDVCDSEHAREITEAEISKIINDFVQCAKKAEVSGFDGIQIHGAHGYLLSSFMDQYKNIRKDKYGGTAKNRVRIVKEIVEAIKVVVSKEFIVSIKIDANNSKDKEFRDDLTDRIIYLDKIGFDLIEVSGIGYNDFSKNMETYWLEHSLEIKKVSNTKISICGGIYNREIASACIAKGIDFVSMARPLISEADLVSKWKLGETDKSRCIRCGQCFSKITKKRCVFDN